MAISFPAPTPHNKTLTSFTLWVTAQVRKTLDITWKVVRTTEEGTIPEKRIQNWYMVSVSALQRLCYTPLVIWSLDSRQNVHGLQDIKKSFLFLQASGQSQTILLCSIATFPYQLYRHSKINKRAPKFSSLLLIQAPHFSGNRITFVCASYSSIHGFKIQNKTKSYNGSNSNPQCYLLSDPGIKCWERSPSYCEKATWISFLPVYQEG